MEKEIDYAQNIRDAKDALQKAVGKALGGIKTSLETAKTILEQVPEENQAAILDDEGIKKLVAVFQSKKGKGKTKSQSAKPTVEAVLEFIGDGERTNGQLIKHFGRSSATVRKDMEEFKAMGKVKMKPKGNSNLWSKA